VEVVEADVDLYQSDNLAVPSLFATMNEGKEKDNRLRQQQAQHQAHHQPAQPQAQAQNAWEKGRTRMTVTVACCPECGSRYLRIKNSKGGKIILLECKECNHQWKDERCEIINGKKRN
jgi:membrane protease subunit (stomatin/prohibitin family)